MISHQFIKHNQSKMIPEYSFLKADMEVDWLKMITQILLDI